MPTKGILRRNACLQTSVDGLGRRACGEEEINAGSGTNDYDVGKVLIMRFVCCFIDGTGNIVYCTSATISSTSPSTAVG